MRGRWYLLTPFQTFLLYIFIGVCFFIIPGVVFRLGVLTYFGIAIVCYSPVAALIAGYMRKKL